MFDIGIAPPMPVSESSAAFTAPHDVTVVIAVQSARVRDAEARLLALEVAAGDPGRVLGDGAVGLGGVDDRDADAKQANIASTAPSPAGGSRPCARTWP